MRHVKMFFDEGLLEFDMSEQHSREYIDYKEIKGSLCAYFGIPSDIPILELDFEKEQLFYKSRDTADTTTLTIQNLAEQEHEIFTILGYEYSDLNNAGRIVDAYINGKISGKLFQVLMDIEGIDNEKNPGIEAFLKSLNGEEEQ